MAIQFRRGAFADFIKSKMVAGEPAVVQSGDTSTQNGKAFYICYTPGSVDRVLTEQDKTAFDSQISDIEDDLTAAEQAIENVQQSIPAVDATLTTAGAAADAKKTGDEIADLKSDFNAFTLMSDDIKLALLSCFSHVAWADSHGQDYYDALEEALYEDNVASISAILSLGTHEVYPTDNIESLRNWLTVTATYDDQTQAVVTDYTLTGDISSAGEKTITVSYGYNNTTTFNVTVIANTSGLLYEWDFTNGLVDLRQNAEAVTTAEQDTNGIAFNAPRKYVDFGEVYTRDRTYEIDVDYINAISSEAQTPYRRLFAFGSHGTDTTAQTAAFLFSGSGARIGWYWYLGSSWDSSAISSSLASADKYSYFNGKTIKIYIASDGYAKVYAKTIGSNDSTYVQVGSSHAAVNSFVGAHAYMGSAGNDSLADARIVRFRVYEGEK